MAAKHNWQEEFKQANEIIRQERLKGGSHEYFETAEQYEAAYKRQKNLARKEGDSKRSIKRIVIQNQRKFRETSKAIRMTKEIAAMADIKLENRAQVKEFLSNFKDTTEMFNYLQTGVLRENYNESNISQPKQFILDEDFIAEYLDELGMEEGEYYAIIRALYNSVVNNGKEPNYDLYEK